MRTAFSRIAAWFRSGPRWRLPAVLLFVAVGLSLGGVAHAEELTGLELGLANVIGGIAVFFGWMFTQLLTFLVELLVDIAAYNGFATADAVDRGWVIVRDLTNMFFILVMLVIAFGTILGVEEYSYKRMLPRLLIMAVVINFSKVICGLLIDFSQVVMLTFVNGFSAIAGGNFVQMFQISGAWEILGTSAEQAAESNLTWGTVGSLVLGAILMLIASVAVAIMMIMLVGRIVMLWLLIVLSPLAFFLSAFPKGAAAGAYSQWWKLFGNYVVVGPFVAFFLWLSLAVAGSGDIAATMNILNTDPEGGGGTSLFLSELGGQQQFASFVISIALLMGGMTLTSQLGVMGGGMMAGSARWFQERGADAFRKPARAVGRGALYTAGSYAKLAEANIAKATGVHLPGFGHYTTGWRKGMDARVSAAQERAQSANLARIERGGAAARWYKMVGAPEVAAKEGLLGTAAGLAFKSAPGGIRSLVAARGNLKEWWDKSGPEIYAARATERREALSGLEDKRKSAQVQLEAAQAEIAASSAPITGAKLDAFQAGLLRAQYDKEVARTKTGGSEAIRKESEANAEAIGEVLSKFENEQEVGREAMAALVAKNLDGGAGRYYDRSVADAETSQAERRSRAEQAADQAEEAIAAIAPQIAQGSKEALKYEQLAVSSRALGGRLPPELAKHKLNGDELAGLYQVAQKQGDTDAMVRVFKKAFADGAADDFGKRLGINVGDSATQNFKNFGEFLQKSTGVSRQQMLTTMDNISAENRGKDYRYSNLMKVGAAGTKAFASDAEYMKARADALNKRFNDAIKEGIVTSLGGKRADGSLNAEPAGMYALGQPGNLEKLVSAIEKNRVSAADLSVLAKSVDKMADVASKIPGGDALAKRIGTELKAAIDAKAGQAQGPSLSDVVAAMRQSRSS